MLHVPSLLLLQNTEVVPLQVSNKEILLFPILNPQTCLGISTGTRGPIAHS